MEFRFTLQCLLWLFCVLNGLAKGQTDDDDNYAIATLGPDQYLRGLKTVTGAGQVICKFLGIPYAIPPVGDRRFKPPEPAPQWSGEVDAVTKSTICPQLNDEDTTSVRSEDCLYLNVYSPNLNGSLPVLVWIHGGGYRFGSGYHDGDGATLARKGIVVVTINYRLGPLGFSSTGDDVMPGNYGMLDQVLALKWVQENIAAFGGDPSMVTIGGESAGAFSVSVQTLSPLSHGLFIRAIMESGSALSYGAVERPGQKYLVKDYTRELAENLGCDVSTSSEIVNCLRQVELSRIMQASKGIEDSHTELVAVPRVENTFGFLPDYPSNLYKDGKYSNVDSIMGANSGEWCWSVSDPQNDGLTIEEFRQQFQSFAHFTNAAEISRLVTETYVGNETDPLVIRANLNHVFADLMFGLGSVVEILKVENFTTTTRNHYFYEFDRRPAGATTPDWCGVTHADERQFVFYDSHNPFSSSPDDQSVSEDVQAMWTNFIKFGDPTPQNTTNMNNDDVKVTFGAGGDLPVVWDVFTKDNQKMLKIDVKSTVVDFPRPQAIPLFEKLLNLMMLTSPVDNVPIVG